MNSVYLKYSQFASIEQFRIDQLIQLGKDIEEDVLSQLLLVHEETSKKLISDLKLHLQSKNVIELKRCAHKFKSSCANLGFMRLHNICLDFENLMTQQQATDSFQIDESTDFVEAIQYEYDQTLLKMNLYLKVS